jgi:hypothetical protein
MVRSDTYWPVQVNGIGSVVHTRQLQQQDLAAQIRAMEQQHLQSQPVVVQTVPPSNPYAWPQISEPQREVIHNIRDSSGERSPLMKIVVR